MLKYLAILISVLTSNEVIAQEELECLALNIYHESRGEEPLGQVAVGYVTLNRVEHNYYPDTICEVVYQDYQFSWVHVVSDHTPYEEIAWQESYNIAQALLLAENSIHDPTYGAIFFNTSDLSPDYVAESEVIIHIGNHNFYVAEIEDLKLSDMAFYEGY